MIPVTQAPYESNESHVDWSAGAIVRKKTNMATAVQPSDS